MASLGLGGLLATILLTGATVCLTSGCSTIGYYAQSATGHLNLVQAARPVPQWLADPATPPRLKARLELSQRIRDFAVADLGEPDNASYRRYADLKRSAAVWNVVAAPELSLELKTWCFAVVGCVAYRGYYERAEAEAFAADLKTRETFDVAVYAVPAYSTLGKLPAADWLADRRSTPHRHPEGDLARLIFTSSRTGWRSRRATRCSTSPSPARSRRSVPSAGRLTGKRPGPPDYEQSEALRRPRASPRYRDELATLYKAMRLGPRGARAPRCWRGCAPTTRRGAGPGALRGLRPLVRQANNARSACSPATPRWCGVRAAVRARRPRFPALLRRGPAARGLADGRAARRARALKRTTNERRNSIDHPPRRNPVMADIHIHRSHALGLAKARKTAWKWAETVEEKFGMECTVIEGKDSDVVEFRRAGVDGKLVVTRDAFELDAKLGFLLGVFRGKIETKIEGYLDALLAPAAKKKAAAKSRPAARKK
jgi:putative polyhydroxyalkanoate system protein